MYLGELLLRKKDSEYEILELTRFLGRSVFHNSLDQDDMVKIRKVLEKCIDDNQTFSMKLDRVNNKVQVKIGETSISISDAVKIRKSLDYKINVITELIESDKGSIEVVGFMQQRRKLYEDRMILNSAIAMLDWSTVID
jgi:hypothetical protein